MEAALSQLNADRETGRAEKFSVRKLHQIRARICVWQRPDPAGGAAYRYLVNDQGVPVYLVDPGINGTHKTRPDGSTVVYFDAPKATLMSYIISEILPAANFPGRSPPRRLISGLCLR